MDLEVGYRLLIYWYDGEINEAIYFPNKKFYIEGRGCAFNWEFKTIEQLKTFLDEEINSEDSVISKYELLGK